MPNKVITASWAGHYSNRFRLVNSNRFRLGGYSYAIFLNFNFLTKPGNNSGGGRVLNIIPEATPF